ncbi:hypothetical protein [Candidatus Magnetaquicoccus inordinatus]|uniref:hypothetical protein n=1 Tax=Candidatus Magnetaquicoccus inordinatus TaxID=2496818 RepID=UPI00102C31D7|nr:hypothetical protein [Candidatus Magnetaquicoccus inordinatus]
MNEVHSLSCYPLAGLPNILQTFLEILSVFEFTCVDVLLVLVCSVGGCVGSVANIISQEIGSSRIPGKGSTIILSSIDAIGRVKWIFLRLVQGLIIGLIIALYFVGSIHKGPASISKVIALSILIGYSAPAFWKKQEIIVNNKLLKEIQENLYQNINKNNENNVSNQDSK